MAFPLLRDKQEQWVRTKSKMIKRPDPPVTTTDTDINDIDISDSNVIDFPENPLGRPVHLPRLKK